MRSCFILLILILPVIPAEVLSQINVVQKDEILTDSLLRIRGEAYISIPLTGIKKAAGLADKLILDKIADSSAFFYINRKSFQQLKESGLSYSYITPPSLRDEVYMAADPREVLEGKGYPTYAHYLSLMDSFRSSYPLLCRIDTIGFSKNGRLILCARLHSGNPAAGERPVMMYSSTIHGDEPTGYVLMLMLIDRILKNYGLYSAYTDLLDEAVILINPLANPDGTYFSGDNTIYGSIRENLNYFDLNRSFPERKKGDDPESFSWQPENSAMNSYLLKNRPSISANFHGGAEVVNYPWDAVPDLHADDRWFHMISIEYADTARETNPSYMSSFKDGVTNGYSWYPVSGGRMDYVTYYLFGREVTIELSDEKIPQGAYLNTLWNLNQRSFLNFLRQGLYGLWGTVTDSATGKPLKAKIEIPGHDILHSCVYSDDRSGKFYRYINEGTYSLEVQSEGYVTRIFPDIQAVNKSRIDVPVRLRSLESIISDNEIIIFPNPFRSNFSYLFRSEYPQDCQAGVYDINGMNVCSGVFISSEGMNRKEISLEGKAPGFYWFRLIRGNRVIQRKVVKCE